MGWGCASKHGGTSVFDSGCVEDYRCIGLAAEAPGPLPNKMKADGRRRAEAAEASYLDKKGTLVRKKACIGEWAVGTTGRETYRLTSSGGT